MTFSFKYKAINLKTGVVYRPLIPITLSNDDKIFDIIAILDSGSDMTILPKEVAEALNLELKGENEVTGIGRKPVKARESSITIKFGKAHELYTFKIPILVLMDMEDAPIIIGREGFFNQFKIIFDEQRKEIEFKKISNPR